MRKWMSRWRNPEVWSKLAGIKRFRYFRLQRRVLASISLARMSYKCTVGYSRASRSHADVFITRICGTPHSIPDGARKCRTALSKTPEFSPDTSIRVRWMLEIRCMIIFEPLTCPRRFKQYDGLGIRFVDDSLIKLLTNRHDCTDALYFIGFVCCGSLQMLLHYRILFMFVGAVVVFVNHYWSIERLLQDSCDVLVCQMLLQHPGAASA